MEHPIKSESFDLQEYCGICLIKQEGMRNISTFLIGILEKCISIKFPLYENVFICITCENEIIKWHTFRQQVQRSLEIIKSMVTDKSKDERIDSAFITVEPECIVKTENLDEAGRSDIDSHQDELDATIHLTIETSHSTNINGNKKQSKKPHKCNSCGEIFETYGKLRTHEVFHKIQKGFKCDICEKEFNSGRSLCNHKKRHTHGSRFPCSHCERSFPFKHNLDRHCQAKHSSSQNFLCTYCPKMFKVRETLNKHIRKSHLGESNCAVCSTCGKSCETLSALKVHARSHTGERPFICEFCSKGFVTNDHLTLHRRIHTGERPFVCKDCGKAFISSSVLRKHNRSHSGERPYVCHLCPKTFALSSALKTHFRSH